MTERRDPPFEEELSAFLADIDYADVPEVAIRTVERSIVDTIGVTLAGFQTDVGERILGLTCDGQIGLDRRSFDVLSAERYRSPPDSALAIGTAAHALDYDDTSPAIRGHPSATLVSSICALAPRTSPTGTDAITAYVAGFEAAAAIAAPIVTEHYRRGWHATATLGIFGSTAASSVLLGLEERQIHHALNMAAAMSSGLKANFGSMTKPLQAGLAAQSGVTAAELAHRGFTSDPAAISGEGGFWSLYADGVGRSPDIERWTLVREGIYIKKYPCCRALQTSLDATLSLVEEHDLTPDRIDSIEVFGSPNAKDILKHPEPMSGLEAKFSIPYTVAHAVVHRSVGLRAFEDDRIKAPSIESIRRRVDFRIDPDLPYNSQNATVRIHTTDAVFEETVEDAYGDSTGDHHAAIGDDELREKFLECTCHLSPDGTARDVFSHFDMLRTRDSFAFDGER